MHYGIEVVPFGEYSNPRLVMELAQAAEAAGWEGITLWDHLLFPYGAGDPWITLAAVAAVTKRIKLCTGVSPLPRYKPPVLARTLVGLDILSGGRVIFGTGAGVDFDFTPFGEAADAKTRAGMLDEGLELLEGLVAGKQVTMQGQYFSAAGAQLVPSGVQQPRTPIWIGGDSQPAYRRAARWDGWIIGTIDEMQNVTLPPEELSKRVQAILAHRTQSTPFDVAIDGCSQPGQSRLVAAYAAAGATWWFEAIFGTRGSHAELLARIHAGPPEI
jgi:alkanesulfonate monooxygenase SsuD/methylene tetrahydromethanopterin reductase-like flavin-dependent oxidoreductase (luciferase family)